MAKSPRFKPDTRKYLRLLLAEAQKFAYPKVLDASFSLATSMYIQVDSDTQGKLRIPQYWAVYVHDGVSGVREPLNASVFIWFRDPLDDPRLPLTGHLFRKSQQRSLTSDELRFWIEQNRIAVKLGLEKPMIVARSVSKTIPAKPFFTEGMAGFSAVANAAVNPVVREDILKAIGSRLNQTKTLTVRF